MNSGYPGRRLLLLFGVAILSMIMITSVAIAADQVILDWEEDASGNPIDTGQVIDDEYHSATGISITVKAQSATGVAAIFPSDAPPGIDYDLGSPNETCPGGGPGIGEGGKVGQLGENCLSHDNVLIMPTSGDGDGDGFIDGTPNDDDRGGTITFLFGEPVTVDYIAMLDQESEENLFIISYADVAGTVELDSQNPSGFGDNSYENILINVDGVRRVDFNFMGSGAIASIAYTPSGPTAVSLSGIEASAVTPTYILLAIALLALITISGLWFARSNVRPVDIRSTDGQPYR